MKTIKVSEATLIQLNWLVACCEGYTSDAYMRSVDIRKDAKGRAIGIVVPLFGDRHYSWFRPTTDWSQGGPIIEREKINLQHISGINTPGDFGWEAQHPWPTTACGWPVRGSTPLISAMRCYVASKLGDTVEVPEEFK